MEELLAEVQETDSSAEDAVKQFVDLKSDAIELSKEFRDTARELLGTEKSENLRNRIQQMKHEKLQQLKERIRKKIQEHNGEQIKKMCGILELDCESLREQLQSGEVTKSEIKNQIREKMQSMTQEQKKEKFAELKEEGVKRNVFRKAAVERARLNMGVRKQGRLSERINKLNATRDPTKILAAQRLKDAASGRGGSQ